jgi:hypothetical protein
MDPSPPRLLPRQRVAAAAAAVTVQRQQQQQQVVGAPVYNDLADPLTGQQQGGDTTGCGWREAYLRAGDKQVPRRLRVFGWQLLHAGLQVGARRMYAAAAGGTAAAEFACPRQRCQQQQPQQQQQQHGGQQQQQQQQQQPQHPPLATLSHVLLECPVAAAAWQFFTRVWQARQPGAAPDVTSSRLLLLDDSSVWAPPAGLAPLWTYLRLQMLECLLVQADGVRDVQQQQQQQPQPGDTLMVVALFRSRLKQQMARDWQRVGGDVRLEAGVPLSWLPGRPPTLSPAQFSAKWGGLAVGTPPRLSVVWGGTQS